MRAFIACEIFHESIEGIIDEIKKAGGNIKFVEPHNMHVTLKFFGEIEETKANEIGGILETVCIGRFPMDAKLRGVGVFPGYSYIRVLWIGVICPELEVVQQSLDSALLEIGFKKEKDFKLHLTVGRVRSAKNKEQLKEIVGRLKDIEIGSVKIPSIKIKKSELTKEGPIYSDLKVVK